jgi:hypothetical protein
MIAESLLFIVLLSYGASMARIDGTSNKYQSNGMEALSWDDSGNLPAAVVIPHQDSEYLSCCASLISTFRPSLRSDQIQHSNAFTRIYALNFLSTRLIL